MKKKEKLKNNVRINNTLTPFTESVGLYSTIPLNPGNPLPIPVNVLDGGTFTSTYDPKEDTVYSTGNGTDREIEHKMYYDNGSFKGYVCRALSL